MFRHKVEHKLKLYRRMAVSVPPPSPLAASDSRKDWLNFRSGAATSPMLTTAAISRLGVARDQSLCRVDWPDFPWHQPLSSTAVNMPSQP